jgi:hypothetical protein
MRYGVTKALALGTFHGRPPDGGAALDVLMPRIWARGGIGFDIHVRLQVASAVARTSNETRDRTIRSAGGECDDTYN